MCIAYAKSCEFLRQRIELTDLILCLEERGSGLSDGPG